MKLDKCLVCDQRYAVTWTDYHGEAECLTCGTPYLILRDGKEVSPPEINLLHDEAMLPVLRQYWQETAKKNGLGSYFGPVRPDITEQAIAFDAWVKSRPELVKRLEQAAASS